MDVIQILKQAIQQQKTVSFDYVKEGKARGERIGNPHAIFGHHQTGNVNVHIYQTAGVSDSKDKLPGWRQFLAGHIENIRIVEDRPSFKVADGYNPNSPMYTNIISKI